MSRRSARLVSGGYYQSDEDSDSSSFTSVSYKESPVRVFKKRTGGRNPASRTSSRASSVASTASHTPRKEPISNADDYMGMAPALRGAQRRETSRAPPPSSPQGHPPLPVLSPAPELGPSPGLTRAHCRSSSAGPYSGGASLLRPKLQSSVDSSGYSSSEGRCDRSAAVAGSTNRGHGRRSAQNTSFSSLICSVAGLVLTARVMKAVFLLFLVLPLSIFGVWTLLPTLTALTRPSKQTPALMTPPYTTMERCIGNNAALEDRMQKLLRDMELKQQRLVSEMELRHQTELRDVRVRAESATLDQHVRLDQEVEGLKRQITDTRSTSTVLLQRLEEQETYTTKLEEELSTMKLAPPPAPPPCPATPTAPLLNELTPELRLAMEQWFSDRVKTDSEAGCRDCRSLADKMPNFALESQGASVISTRCSETLRTRPACVSLFGFPLWYESESPRTVIQGNQGLLPGKCWAFEGVQGTMVVSLSHPVRITHVTLEHLSRSISPTGRIDSAPRDFLVYGMSTEVDEGVMLGRFTYDQHGDSTQTFQLPNPNSAVHRYVELRILSNWGHMEYTCLYRFRVHGRMAGA